MTAKKFQITIALLIAKNKSKSIIYKEKIREVKSKYHNLYTPFLETLD